MEAVIEISKEFLVVAVAVWVLVAALYKIKKLELYVPKELMAIIIGIIAIVAGVLTGLFTGNIVTVVSVGIVAVYVAQGLYDKVKVIFTQLKK